MTGVYGPAIGIDGIGNTQVGGPNGAPTRQVAYRFRARATAALSRIQFTQTTGSGYWGGTGGSLSITLQTDNGAGDPSGTILASASFIPRNVAAYWPVVSFTSPPALTAGTLYHIVFQNTDADPATNYPSLNNHYVSAMETPLLPRYPDTDWRELIRDGGSWYDPRPDGAGAYIPQLALFYADGTVDGICYPYVAGTLSLPVTETFTPKTDRSITSLGLRVKGSGSARLEAAGVEVETVTFSGSGKWTSLPFTTAHTLKAGTTYSLVISGTGSIEAMYKGSAYGNWPVQTYFADGALAGHADQDIPFYFR